MKNVITLTREEYLELLKAKKKLSLKTKVFSLGERKRGFSDSAFGILKRSFGKGSSSSYIAKIRASWRG